jgi:phage minor structural protein
MMKIYDSARKFLALLDGACRNVYTTETLSTGYKTLCFQVPCLPEYLNLIQEENYVGTEDYTYVIKEILLEGNDFLTVYANADVEDLDGTVFNIFDCFEKSVEQSYLYCLEPVNNWSLQYESKNQSLFTLQTAQVSSLEMIREIAKLNGQELWFDTKRRVVIVYDKMGVVGSTYYSNELRLKQLRKQSSTYDYATILIPIGKDGLRISSVNNGKDYLENFTYSDKYIQKFWVNEDYTVPELLMGAGQDYLDSIAMPRASYKLELAELGDTIGLGDVVMIVDAIKRVKQEQRAVKIVRYPYEPERDSVELSNLQVDFARTFIEDQKVLQKEIAYLKKVIAEMK